MCSYITAPQKRERGKAYSRGIKLLRRFTLASTQSLASSFKFRKMIWGGVDFFWKTLAFLSFQMVQVVSKVRVAIALLCLAI